MYDKRFADPINCYALLVAIFEKCNPERAYDLLTKDNVSNRRDDITEDDIKDMIIFRTEYKQTYKEIGEIYNLKPTAVFHRIKRYQNKILSGGQ